MDTFLDKSWTCATCSQGFTRRTSARRHNDRLHNRQAVIIRPTEYVIGRLSGQIPRPQDPLRYRRPGMYRLHNEPQMVAHNMRDRNDSYDSTESTFSPGPGTGSKSTESLASTSNDQMIINTKLNELAILLHRNCKPEHVSLFLSGISANVNAGKTDVLDAYLSLFRTLDKH
jgi:hypothetical protein